MTTAWLWLAAGVLAQWGFVAALRASSGLRRPGWAVVTFVLMIASMGAVAVAIDGGLTVAVAYGVWTGAGILLAAVTGAVVFGDRLSGPQRLGLALVLAGVVALNLAGAH